MSFLIVFYRYFFLYLSFFYCYFLSTFIFIIPLFQLFLLLLLLLFFSLSLFSYSIYGVKIRSRILKRHVENLVEKFCFEVCGFFSMKKKILFTNFSIFVFFIVFFSMFL